MKKNKISLFSLLTLLTSILVSCNTIDTQSSNEEHSSNVEESVSNNSSISETSSNDNSESSSDVGNKEEVNMTNVEKEYYGYINNLSTLPINFVYDNVYYSGFDSNIFKVVGKDTYVERNKEVNNITLLFKEHIRVNVETAIYKDYDAYEYKVSFKNISKNNNTGVFKYLNVMDLDIKGKTPKLKGILGDHQNQYKPYEYDLLNRNVNFKGTTGRATHINFPYFNLENDNGGALLAIGWSGTWSADFVTLNDETVNFKATGTLGMETYLKPNELIRTPLMAVVRYDERDEDKAMNKWRKWFVDCNMPRDKADTDEPVKPTNSAFLAYDTGRPNSDGSISEGNDTWKRSLDAIYDNNLDFDFRWFDAGWYFSPKKQTVVSDWWGTVGSWDLDTIKWPDNSFRESVDYAHAHGTDTFVWFEPERVTYIDDLAKNYGYDTSWAITDHGNNNTYVNNLGNADCLDWTYNRIIKMMSENDVDLYREDFNLDPTIFFEMADVYEGQNRKGITENKFYQGHYELWDRIIKWCGDNGKYTYVDSCASGGGRNDLESMRRGVPFLRSDSDRTTAAIRLAMTSSFSKWIPFNGAVGKESGGQLENGVTDQYILRATYLGHFSITAGFYTDKKMDYEPLKACTKEWREMNKYILKDFYVLTPYNGVNNDKNWTVYEYYDPQDDSGVIQAFRQAECETNLCKVIVKGVDPNKYYTLTDVEGNNSLAKIKGSMLLKGYNIRLNQKRSSALIYIKPWTE